MKKKYHYFYKIENTSNNKVYYGIHSTNNLNDGYMGSGSRLKSEYKNSNKNDFVKTILKFFKTRKEASDYEAEVVTESLVKDVNCYNIKCGGDYGSCLGTILVKDENGKFSRCTKSDDEFKNGNLVPFTSGIVIAKHKLENNYKLVLESDFYQDRESYVTPTQGKIMTVDKNGRFFSVDKNDARLINGVIKPIWSGRRHTKETRLKMSNTHKKNNDQVGNKNSQFGTMWITDGVINKKINICDSNTYLTDGWKKGRCNCGPKQKYNISFEEICECVDNDLSISQICEKFGFSELFIV